MPESATTERPPLREVNNKANQSPAPQGVFSTNKGTSGTKEPEHIDLTSDNALPALTMISGGSASIGETVDGRKISSVGQSMASASRKRKPDAPPEESVNLDDCHVEGMPIDKDPDQVRRQVRRFLDNGGMKVGEFCSAIDVSNNAYNRFMQQSGSTKGLGSDVYDEA